MPLTLPPSSRPTLRLVTPLAALLLAQGLAGCQAVSNTFGGSKVDYRAQAQPASKLDVPPDLTQLSSDPRYQPPTGAPVSANALQGAAQASTAAARATAPAAATAVSQALRIERVGNQRWLVSNQTPEQLWPQLQDYWRQNGFTLTTDKPELGLIETDWLNNRSKLPQDGLNRLLNKVFDNLSDSGERDRYRMLVERGTQGTEISISHQGASQVVLADKRTASDQVRWQSRPSDPSLEAEMLARLMVQLTPATAAAPTAAAVAEASKTLAAAPATPPRARLDSAAGASTLQVDDGFDRAWRRVGLALDRGGFTVEDRDRSQGTYFVRYIDPKLAGAEQPNFISRLFGAEKPDVTGRRFRVKVAAQGNSASTVAVLEAEGVASKPGDESARNIAQLLLNELR
ncbi:outer membrane protein assembly factor BamC [Leptothrix discophora]|uniref:Outer membrane protein assembly factor BamC n=1 Tax=Leptothrix discophora TaxID=89 RepID=A0ABT9G315_LEPDI|nr:outer membrane protein assembly factor BamC [Leptothrix discophora]MDP4300573.1 outer membrane protein assembly factor BamC [Leptothrix discophora]